MLASTGGINCGVAGTSQTSCVPSQSAAISRRHPFDAYHRCLRDFDNAALLLHRPAAAPTGRGGNGGNDSGLERVRQVREPNMKAYPAFPRVWVLHDPELFTQVNRAVATYTVYSPRTLLDSFRF